MNFEVRLQLGEIFQLKTTPEKLREELIPSFDAVLESWIKQVKTTDYADPEYFLKVTYLTEPVSYTHLTLPTTERV